MIQIPINFPLRKENTDENCKICEEKDKMEHFYSCKWGQEDITKEYEHIYGDNLRKIRDVYIRFKSQYQNREKHKNMRNHPRDPICDPIFSVYECSNGNISK